VARPCGKEEVAKLGQMGKEKWVVGKGRKGDVAAQGERKMVFLFMT
jgi:hypothetical protein